MGRAECLAATALVVAARQEPVAGLRRLAAEDPALRRLARVADACAAGASLPAALAGERLLARSEAAALAAAAPDVLAEGLTRLAQASAGPVPGELLARWLPVWAILVATLPSLLIGSAVALVAGSLYGGPFATLSFWEPMPRQPGWLWLLQVGATLTAVAMTGGLLWTLRRTALWPLTIVSLALERAVLLDELVHAARAGQSPAPSAQQPAASGQRPASSMHVDRLFRRWALLTGAGGELRQACERCAGDIAATLVEIGVVPRDIERRPDWAAACAATRLGRRLAAAALAPWLGALLVVVGLAGFFTWGVSPWLPFYDLINMQRMLL